MKSSLLFLCLFIALNVFSDRSIIWHSSFFPFLSKHICFEIKTPMFRFQNTGVLNLTDRMQIYKRLIDSIRP